MLRIHTVQQIYCFHIVLPTSHNSKRNFRFVGFSCSHFCKRNPAECVIISQVLGEEYLTRTCRSVSPFPFGFVRYRSPILHIHRVTVNGCAHHISENIPIATHVILLTDILTYMWDSVSILAQSIAPLYLSCLSIWILVFHVDCMRICAEFQMRQWNSPRDVTIKIALTFHPQKPTDS